MNRWLGELPPSLAAVGCKEKRIGQVNWMVVSKPSKLSQLNLQKSAQPTVGLAGPIISNKAGLKRSSGRRLLHEVLLSSWWLQGKSAGCVKITRLESYHNRLA